MTVPSAAVDRAAHSTILVADDNDTNRVVLRSMLTRDGHHVIEAMDGQDAVEKCEAHSPDLVLMDVMMPHMDGIEATRRIKAACGNQLIPVIFLTANTEEETLVTCLEAGGDDFLGKPFKPSILRAKIGVALRLRSLYASCALQRDALADVELQRQRDMQLAERILLNASRTDGLKASNLRCYVRPMDRLNGDLVLAGYTPAGIQQFFVGDFTGHGLPAAVGAMTVTGIFTSMTKKGFGIAVILEEMNRKLRNVMPTGMFLAACFLELDATRATLLAWNAGMPDVLVRRAESSVLRRIRSKHPPLGVLDNTEIDVALEHMEVDRKDRLYLYTDGVIEAVAVSGERYTQERLELLIAQGEPASVFDGVCLNASQHDDIALVELNCDAEPPPKHDQGQAANTSAKAPTAWRVELELEADTLRQVDPLPPLLQLIADIQGVDSCREQLYVIIRELFTNALEHGLLRLDSKMKDNAEGFAEFYALREQRLTELQIGKVRVELQNTPLGQGGCLVLRLEHDGEGFEPNTLNGSDMGRNGGYRGRGIPLVKSLCKELRYREDGREVEARYEWQWSVSNSSGAVELWQ